MRTFKRKTNRDTTCTSRELLQRAAGAVIKDGRKLKTVARELKICHTTLQRPSKFKTEIIIGSLVILLVVTALCGFLITSNGSSKHYEPPDPIEPLKPSASWLHTFKKTAVCTFAPPCSEIGSDFVHFTICFCPRTLIIACLNDDLRFLVLDLILLAYTTTTATRKLELEIRQNGWLPLVIFAESRFLHANGIYEYMTNSDKHNAGEIRGAKALSQILAKNGSAVDAAIAAMFCNGFLNHQSMGLGGGFFMTVYIRDEEKAYTVIAREKAPLAATRDMFQGDASKSSKGPLAMGVPGELRGMWAAHQRWGKLPWADLVSPTLDFCTYGFQMSKILHDALHAVSYVKSDPILNKMYVDPSTNMFQKPGTIVKPSEAFCKTLRLISERGGDELYNGSLASDFLDDLKRIGSIISAEDLRGYQAQIKETIDVRLENGHILHVPPPPSSGLILANILNILTGYHFGPHNIDTTEGKILTYHRIIEAFKFAYATRTKLGDADFLELDELMRNVTQPEYGTEIRSRINDMMTSNNSATYGAEVYQPPDAGTAHISIIAGNGDAVSITSSINRYFGAGIATLNTGILMNNVMDDFSSPGITNLFGLEPSPANFIAPGKRPLSSMSPIIITDAVGNVKMVLGASAGTKITTAVALVAIRKLWFEQSIKEAVDEARIHHQLFPMEIGYEYGITEGLVQGLKAKGHAMTRYRGRGSTVCALYRNNTAIYGNADFRKGGDVSGD